MTRRNGDIAAPSHSGWPPAGWRPDRLSCLTGLNTSNLPASDLEVPGGTHLTIQVVAVIRYQRPTISGLGYNGVHTAASIENLLVGPLSGILFVTVVGQGGVRRHCRENPLPIASIYSGQQRTYCRVIDFLDTKHEFSFHT